MEQKIEKKRFKPLKPNKKTLRPLYDKRIYDGSAYIESDYTYDDKAE